MRVAHSRSPALTPAPLLKRLWNLPTSSFDILLVWQQRTRDRRQLLALSDHALKDIGLSRADIVREAQKPFWRP